LCFGSSFESSLRRSLVAVGKTTHAAHHAEHVVVDGVDAHLGSAAGAHVVDAEGIDRGICIAVIDNPANDLLELDTGHLVPNTFVVRLADGIIHVDTPDGLFDLLG
jgi:hypothetical protein